MSGKRLTLPIIQITAKLKDIPMEAEQDIKDFLFSPESTRHQF